MNQPWKIIVPTLIFGVLLGAFGTKIYLSQKQEVVEEKPSLENQTTITGIFRASDRFGGTEMGCDFSNDAKIGDRRPCNKGNVLMAIETEDKMILLDGYTCQATEILVKEEQGIRTEYETSNCKDGLEQGKTYSVTGTLELHKDQWNMGKQRNEWWMQVQEISLYQTEPDLTVFTNQTGSFQFKVPKGVKVSCKQECYLSSPTEENPQPVPDMTISVKDGEVIFRTWEGFDIPYFEDVVSSFEFLKEISSEEKAIEWTTYNSREKDLHFQYPNDWKLTEKSNEKAGVTLTSPSYQPIRSGEIEFTGEISIRTLEKPLTLSVEDFFDTFDDTSRFWFEKYQHEEAVYNGISAIIFPKFQEGDEEYYRTQILFLCGENVISLSYFDKDGSGEYQDTLKQIVNTVSCTVE